MDDDNEIKLGFSSIIVRKDRDLEKKKPGNKHKIEKLLCR